MDNRNNIMEKNHFNDVLRERTLGMAVQIHSLFRSKQINQINRPMVNQVIRSSSSVAANFRAAARARSDAEFYAKICIATEECDETQFWLNYLIRIDVLTPYECCKAIKEVEEEIKIFSSIKKKMRDRIKA
jgi:four helix bundle protein